MTTPNNPPTQTAASDTLDPRTGKAPVTHRDRSIRVPALADDEFCDLLDPDDDSIELLAQHAVRLPFAAYPIGEEEGGIRWFLRQDVLLRDDDGMAVLARGRTAENLDRVHDLIPRC
ncbi:hypothetical protein ACFV1F_20555 [Streptomyces sp. NPDC059590]|uniref:hypothetical protein n=1 Tax=Streptomyces sp. NPDC059590 TaxID=3346877 RepID=UPI00368CD4A5